MSRHRNLLRVTRLDSVMDVHDSDESALASFMKSAAAGA
jgi:hypothetical protein